MFLVFIFLGRWRRRVLGGGPSAKVRRRFMRKSAGITGSSVDGGGNGLWESALCRSF